MRQKIKKSLKIEIFTGYLYNFLVNNYENLISKIKNYQNFKGQIQFKVQMSQKTTFKTGGTADVFITPENFNSFQIVLSEVLSSSQKFFILGGGSNIVFPDGEYHGIVISTASFSNIEYFPPENLPPSFGKIELPEDKVLISCFCGTTMASFVNFCTKNNISGAEVFAGLPGTVGGAVFMNARCFNVSISDILFSTSWLDYSDKNISAKKSLFNSKEWDYKKSPFQNNNRFITTATFLLNQKTESEHSQIESECKKYISERVSKGHFKFPSAGSVFKNNHSFGAPSGKLIDECGLKGFSIGGAQVAPFHGNFIINTGNATSQNIKELVNYVQAAVQKKYGFTLENEIIFVDNQE